MNTYIVTVKFLPRSWSDSKVIARPIIGRWIVKANSCVDAIEITSDSRGETVEARAVKLIGKENTIHCIEYDGVAKYGLGGN